MVADLETQLRRAGVPNVEAVVALAAQSLHLVARLSNDPWSLPPGASRFGGSPDVPAGFDWPRTGRRALTFLAQFDLSEVAGEGLPATGWLLFFYDMIEMPWGFDPADSVSFRVMHVSGDRAQLKRVEEPGANEDEDPLPTCELSFERRVELPELRDHLLRSGGCQPPRELHDAYNKIIAGLTCDDNRPNHHLLGHPQSIQGEMRSQCQLVTNGIFCGSTLGPVVQQRADQLAPGASDWVLLLQLDSDPLGPGWRWRDGGRIYYWIRRQDLAARAFDKAWLVLQSS